METRSVASENAAGKELNKLYKIKLVLLQPQIIWLSRTGG